MWSRRHFLHHCVASSAGLVLATGTRAADKPEAKEPDPFLTPATQKAIASGLNYLKNNQHEDGSFGNGPYRGSVGITSLCGLALLSGGHSPGVGPFGPAVDSAVDFVMGKEDPRQRGFLHNAAASPHGPMYNHGFAVGFLAKALADFRDKKRAEKLREVLDRAVLLTLASQSTDKSWRYQPTPKDGDVTVTACQVCALRAARDAGTQMPREALDGAAGYIKKCQEEGGGFRYMPAGGTAGWARTAAGLLALYCAGVTRGPEIDRAQAYLLKNRPDPKAARPDMHYYYGHYYAALATWAAGGDTRKAWYPAARDELLARQGADGAWVDQIDVHYATAMALIALQAPNGFLSPKA